MKKLLLTLCFCLITSVSFGALVEGTNCGFVTSAPTSDPSGAMTAIIDNNSLVCKFTTPASAITVTEMGWWCDNATEASNFQLGIYLYSTLASVYNSGDVAKGTTAGWKTVTGLSVSLSASTDYYLGAQLDNTATATNIDSSNLLDLLLDYNINQTSLPNPWVSFDPSLYGVAIYALYTTDGGGGVVKTYNGLAWASVKTIKGLAVASVKTINGAAAQ